MTELDFKVQNIGQDENGDIIFTYRTMKDPLALQIHTDESFEPYFFAVSDGDFADSYDMAKNQGYVARHEETEIVAFGNRQEQLRKVVCKSSWDIRKARGYFRKTYEADIMYVNRYMVDKFWNKTIPDQDARVNIIDIEVLLGDNRSFPDYREPVKVINCVGVYDSYEDKYYQFVLAPMNLPKKRVVKQVRNDYMLILYKDEKDMLKGFLDFVQKNTPDIYTGWNVQFDMRYLVKRMEVLIGKRAVTKMSPFGKYHFDEFNSFNYGGGEDVRIRGVSIIDYMDLYKAYTLSVKSSYSLDNISKEELGVGKIDWKVKYKDLDDVYYSGFKDFLEYNLIDVQRVKELNDKLKFIKNMEALTTHCLCPKEDYLTTTKLIDGLILQKAKEKGIALPTAERNIKTEKIAGAFVKEPKKGRFQWVMSFDLNSLYPNLIDTINISPECKRSPYNDNTDRPDDEYVVAGNKVRFIKPHIQKGFFSEICKYLLDERKIFKDKMLDAKSTGDDALEKRHYYTQYALKALANSIYGVMSNERFRFYDRDMAEAVTISGQLVIQFIASRINTLLNKKLLKLEVEEDFIIAGDTDSIYINMGAVMEKYDDWIMASEEEKIERLIKMGDRIKDIINQVILPNCCDSLFNINKGEQHSLFIKMETIADSSLFLTKKRYVLRMVHDDGIPMDQKVKYVGVEIKRSDTSKISKDVMKEVIGCILDGGNNPEANKIVRAYQKVFKESPLEDIAFPIGVSKPLEKYETKPIHIKGALIYNKYFAQNENEKITFGTKVKYLYLTEKFIIPPLKERTKVVSFPEKCPVERQYVDWEIMEDRIIKQKLSGIFEVMGFTFPGVAKQTSILDF